MSYIDRNRVEINMHCRIVFITFRSTPVVTGNRYRGSIKLKSCLKSRTPEKKNMQIKKITHRGKLISSYIEHEIRRRLELGGEEPHGREASGGRARSNLPDKRVEQ